MPHLSGMQLAKKILELRPGVPLILCSGYGRNEILEEGRKLGIAAILSKPIPAAELARSIRAVFDGPGIETEVDRRMDGGNSHLWMDTS